MQRTTGSCKLTILEGVNFEKNESINDKGNDTATVYCMWFFFFKAGRALELIQKVITQERTKS